MKPLSKGDTCRVRLHTGEVVEAVYDHQYCGTDHEVYYNGRSYCASYKIHDKSCVRFVGPPCVLVPVGVSV